MCIKVLFIISCGVSLINGNVIVETRSGKVSGITTETILENKEFFSFLGIPFAEPPIGDLRFMPPQPKQKWDDIITADKEPTACAQVYVPLRSKSLKDGYFGDEDCLYLSVHTPKIETETLQPVIVYVYNDLFRNSYNGSTDFGPDFFMEEGILFITINHRLGSIGFLGFEDELLPGNNGLRDIILALNWVKTNINAFGGDPSKVTLMGSKGGAAAVDALLHSKIAKGLFHAAILQSGTIWNSMYLDNQSKRKAIALSDLVNKKANTGPILLDKLLNVKAVELLEIEHRAIDADESRAVQVGKLLFGPIVEHDHPDAVLNYFPEDSPIDIDIPIMAGYNSREGLAFCTRYLERPQFLTYADRDFLFIFPIRHKYHFDMHQQVYYDAIQEIKDFYFEEGYVKVKSPGEYITYIGDVMLMYPIDVMVRQYSNASKAPVYYYTFDFSGKFNAPKLDTLSNAVTWDGTWGASGGDELCHLLVCKSIKGKYAAAAKNPEAYGELKVVKNMVRLWSNFAKTGNPTPSKEDDVLNGFTWEPTTPQNHNILEITKDLNMKSNHLAGRIKFWDDFLKKYEAMAVNGVVRDVHDEL